MEVGGAGVGEMGLVRIQPTDVVFSTDDCERWHRVGD
jgi:hypothetical protein